MFSSATTASSDTQPSLTTQLIDLLERTKQELQDAVTEASIKTGFTSVQVKQTAQQLLASAAISTSLLLGDGHPASDTYYQATAPAVSQQVEESDGLATSSAQGTPQPSHSSVAVSSEEARLTVAVTAEEHQEILEKIAEYTQQPPGHLPHEEELYVEQQLSDMLGFTVTAELDNHRLNHSIGAMGGEQHLKRHPTDTLEAHDAYRESGIAANRGAFGWFTEQGKLTELAIQREKYYFAVQTMYLPDWNSNHAKLKPWYAFRKMIVINPYEQTAVVGVVGDAGPAKWVQKQFGGSPEVIREGKIWSKATRGRVMLLFVDDPDDQIPLGPIDMSFEARYQVKPSSVAEESGL